MTTQTRVLPELDEALDFEPTCTVGRGQSPHGIWYADPCEARASWVAILSCCGQARLWCESHKVRYTEHPALSTRWACIDCGAWWHMTVGLVTRALIQAWEEAHEVRGMLA